MKQSNKLSRAIITIVMVLGVSLSTLAHDFEVDGIYYNILDETAKMVEVTFSGSSSNKVDNEYIGDVVIPNSVTYGSATYSVTTIGGSAFRWCSKLTSVTIPRNSDTYIGDEAFMRCSNLNKIISLNPTPPSCESEGTFYRDNYTNATLYIPKDSYDKYFRDGVWGKFINIVKSEL